MQVHPRLLIIAYRAAHEVIYSTVDSMKHAGTRSLCLPFACTGPYLLGRSLRLPRREA
jgi:hypothetical protein